MPDKLTEYRRADARLPERNRLWPLYGAGLESLGDDGRPIEVPMPSYGPDELLVRHDACGLCFSDIKVIRLGPDHPRIYRDMQSDPVTLGHEVSITIAGVGETCRISTRSATGSSSRPTFSWMAWVMPTATRSRVALSEYGVIDQRILNGDDGNYLIPVQPQTGYAESALTEPWACVIAAYQLQYRTGLKPAGTTWIVGSPDPESQTPDQYTISAGFDEDAHPARLLLTDVPAVFAAWLRERAAALGVEVIEAPDLANPPVTPVDDIVLLGADAEVVETVSPHLADLGIVALVAEKPLSRKVAVDVGRVHYNRWVYVGAPGPDIAQAYSKVRRSAPRSSRGAGPGSSARAGRWAACMSSEPSNAHDGPGTIVCTDVSDLRLDDLCTSFAAEAEGKGIEWICLNPLNKEDYEAGMARFKDGGFDDIIVLAPVPPVIADAATYLAPGGVMNVFAGVARGRWSILI